MSRFAALFCCVLAFSPASAQDERNLDEGLDLLSQGTQLLLRGLMDEIEPTLRDLEPMVRDLQPFLLELGELMPDFQLYHRPEVLPNGDIIIRRKREGETIAPGEIEL